MDLGLVLEDKAEISRQIDVGRGAGRVDRAQDVQDRSSELGLAELRGENHQLLDPKRPLDRVIRSGSQVHRLCPKSFKLSGSSIHSIR